MYDNHIYKFSKCVSDGGFEGWGKGEADEAAGDFFSQSVYRVLKPRSQIVKVK